MTAYSLCSVQHSMDECLFVLPQRSIWGGGGVFTLCVSTAHNMYICDCAMDVYVESHIPSDLNRYVFSQGVINMDPFWNVSCVCGVDVYKIGRVVKLGEHLAPVQDTHTSYLYPWKSYPRCATFLQT